MEITHDLIIEECCLAFGVSVKEALSPSRKNLCVLARQLACKIMKDELNYSYAQIGEIIGNGKKPRHHTTAIHSYRAINSFLDIHDYLIVNAYYKVLSKLYKRHEGYEKITIHYKPGFEIEKFKNFIIEHYPNVMILKE